MPALIMSALEGKADILGRRARRRVAARQLKDDAINAARQTLSACWFDAAETDDGLQALRSYRKEWDEEKGVWRDTPRHDKASHGADAFQTLSVWWREMRDEEKPETLENKLRREHAEATQMIQEAIKPKTLNEIIEDYECEMADV
jgi:phage terminase large subunit